MNASLAELPTLDEVRAEKACRSLDAFARRMLQLEPVRHHRFVNERLEAVERGEIARLMLFEPPGHAKSIYASHLFPGWYLGRNPARSVIAASHTAQLATRFGRRVRNLYGSPDWPFPDVVLASDSKAADQWETVQGGEYFAVGVGGAVTGRRADLAIIDDPLKGRKDADSITVRENLWDWYRADFHNRLKPGAAIILIQCMTGDTPVLMAAGHEKLLRNVRPGDRVATYENGKISASTVRNWTNNGPDRVYEIRMKSGIIAKANARHPFLVEEGGETKWQRTATLKKGSVILNATLLSATGRLREPFSPPLGTHEITRDTVAEIVKGGVEEVFDVEIERTANFIANGLVSHNTRWHEDDLAGRILPADYAGSTGWVAGQDGERWYVINLPALAEANDALGRAVGEVLWPEWFSDEMLETEKIVQGPRNWAALYQQRPAPEEGNYFLKDWWRWYETAPPVETLRVYGASDYAVTADGGDFTVHGVGGVDADDNLYMLDWWRNRTASDVWVETLLDLMQIWRPLTWAEEKGQIEKSIGPFIDKRMRERRVYCHREQYASSADKAVRAQAFRARMAMGKIYWPRKAPWVDDVYRALMTFPAGAIDDDVDVCSLFGRMLDPVQAFGQAEVRRALSDKIKPLFGEEDDGIRPPRHQS